MINVAPTLLREFFQFQQKNRNFRGCPSLPYRVSLPPRKCLIQTPRRITEMGTERFRLFLDLYGYQATITNTWYT